MNLHQFIFKKFDTNPKYFISFEDWSVTISHGVVIHSISYYTKFVIDKTHYLNDDAKWTKLNKDINSFIKQSTSIEKLLGN